MDKKTRCPRCSGRKRVFKIGKGYTLVDNGGQSVSCPFCLGEGVITPYSTAMSDIQPDIVDPPKRGRKKKSDV